MDDQPSNNWMDLSLLIGNEQLGAMIFGGIGRPYHLYFHDEITSFIVFVANVYNTILPQGILRHHLRRKILNTSDTLFRLQRSLTIMNGIFSVTLLFLLFTFNISAQQKVPENNIIPMNHSVRPQETLTLWMTSHQTTGWIFHFLSVTNN